MTAVSANIPAAEKRPPRMTMHLGLGLDQFLRCPDSTLNPISSKISATAKQILTGKIGEFASHDEIGTE